MGVFADKIHEHFDKLLQEAIDEEITTAEKYRYRYVFERTKYERRGYETFEYPTIEGVTDTHQKMEELLKELQKKWPKDTITIYKFKRDSLECEDSYNS